MKHKTSVLIVNSREKTSKVRQVPTHIIVHWRKYAAFLSLLIISFILVSGFLIYQNTSRVYQERLDRANYIRSRIDLHKALTAFASIDSGMYRINSFLQDRGLEKLKMDNMGGGNKRWIWHHKYQRICRFLSKAGTGIGGNIKFGTDRQTIWRKNKFRIWVSP